MTLSHPVKAWNTGNAIHRSGPSAEAISCSNESKTLPNSKSNPQPFNIEPMCCCYCQNYNICINSAYWYQVVTLTDSIFQMKKNTSVRFFMCTWWQTWYILVICTKYVGVACAQNLLGSLNVYSSCCQECKQFSLVGIYTCQFPGSVPDGSTRFLTPLPFLLRVSAFRLSLTYLSQTMSSWFTCWSCAEMHGKKLH